MKSNIKFVTSRDNKQKHDLWTSMSEYCQREKISSIFMSKSMMYLALLYSKYIIEREDLNPSTIINGKLDELMPYLKERFSELKVGSVVPHQFKNHKFYELLKKIIYEDYEIDSYIDRVLDHYLDKKKRYLLVTSEPIKYIPYSNVDIIVNPSTELDLFYNQVLDEIVGINKKYYMFNEVVDIKQYDSIIYINDANKYMEFKSLSIKTKSINNKDIFMITKYNNISNTDISFLDIKSVMLDKDKAYITINRNSPFTKNIRIKEEQQIEYKVNIKELSNVPDEDLERIIKTDEEIENISIYINREDIMKNRHRIGFSSYLDFSMDKSKILRLIDHNEHLTKRIRELDKEIEDQVNKLIVR